MKIALVQQEATADKQDNVRRGLAALERAARAGASVVAFAELAFERFHPQHPAAPEPWRLAETVPGPLTDAFSRKARELGVVIVLNLYERDGERAYDCSPVIDADGSILGRTRMIHITDYPCFHEQGYYTPGDTGAPVYRTKAGAVGVAICYDRHYPEYMRALAIGGAELVVVPQAGALDEWPEGLYEGEMQVAAFQNGYFVALCNRVGREECLHPTAHRTRGGDPGLHPIAHRTRDGEECLHPTAHRTRGGDPGLHPIAHRTRDGDPGLHPIAHRTRDGDPGLTFGGESFVCSPDGAVMARAARMEEALLVTEIDLTAVPLSHARRLFMRHRRPELYPAWVGKP